MEFGDSRSNVFFRDIRGADFVSKERTLGKPIPIARNAYRVSPKMVENGPSDGFELNLSRTVKARTNKLYTVIGVSHTNTHIGYDVASSFQLAANCS